MRITLINGSPKADGGASGVILEILHGRLGGVGPGSEVQLLRPGRPGDQGLFPVLDSDCLALSFPLYMDGIPSGLLSFLENLAERSAASQAAQPQDRRILVYTAVNSGFFEAGRSACAIEAVRVFCQQAGFAHGQAVALEGGPLISMWPDKARKGNWPFGRHLEAIERLANNMRTLNTGPDVDAQPQMPRFVYNFGANRYFLALARKNGLKPKDLGS